MDAMDLLDRRDCPRSLFSYSSVTIISRRFFRMSNQMRTVIMMTNATPPTTPPAIAPASLPDGGLGVDVPTLRVLVLMQLVAAHSLHERVVAVQDSSASHTGHLGSVSGQERQRRKIVLPENCNARSSEKRVIVSANVTS
jgi:hypothetical protein